MAELEPTAAHVSSPIKPLVRPVNSANREELSQHVFPRFTSTISEDDMFRKLGYTAVDSNQLRGFPIFQPVSQFSTYLNSVSDFVKEKEAPNVEWSIRFVNTPDNAPQSHWTGTKCRPDFVAVKMSVGRQIDLAKPHWSQLEATGEVESTSDSKKKAHAHAASYTGFLLQARPDYITVPGIFVNQTEFKIFITNACQCYGTNLIQWKAPAARRLLYAWVRLLYEPNVDKSITIRDSSRSTPLLPPPPTFTIQISEKILTECTILRAGDPFGRRTIVLEAPDTVIKEQYVETDRRFSEGPILEKIHGDGYFPGVVRVKQFGIVKLGEEDIAVEHGGLRRIKNRLVLLDKGEPLMKAKTPRELLMALYDLLEITRILWRKFKILHRDISSNNVLLRDKIGGPHQPAAKDLDDMCFSAHLLDRDTSSPSARCSKLDTKVLLIDLDMSEDQTPLPTRTEQPKPRTGTPIFMARAVRSGKYAGGEHIYLPAMPELTGACAESYMLSLGTRLTTFSSKNETIDIPDNTVIQPFQHRLRYDAESVFWCFLWWSLGASPTGCNPSDYVIPLADWTALTGGVDRRHGLIRAFPENALHPQYQPLETLLKQMASQLSGDHDFSQDECRKHDEYMHETFQRLILGFLFDNHDASFMNLEKGPNDRTVEKGPGMSQMSSPSPRSSAPAARPSVSSRNTSNPEPIPEEPRRSARQRQNAP